MKLFQCEIKILGAVEASYVFDAKDSRHEVKKINDAIVAVVDHSDMMAVLIAVYATNYENATAHQWTESDGTYRLLLPGFTQHGAKRFIRKVRAFIEENNLGFGVDEE